MIDKEIRKKLDRLGRLRTSYSSCVILSSLLILDRVENIVEIGVFKGRCSKVFRKFYPEAHLWLIDPWKQSYFQEDSVMGSVEFFQKSRRWNKMAYEVMQHFQNDKLTHIIRKPSVEAAKHVPDNCDLIFIDGNHTELAVRFDLKNYIPKVRKGGIICGHDYKRAEGNGVIKAVNSVFGKENIWLGPGKIWLYVK